MKNYTVMILYGGEGYERDVSVKSAGFFEKAKEDSRITLIFVYISSDGRLYLSKNGRATADSGELAPLSLVRGGAVAEGRYIKVDLALPVLHGDLGEDGYAGAILLHHKIRCALPPYHISAVARDKAAVKLFARDKGIPVCDFIYYPEGYEPQDAELSEAAQRLSFPIFVKPRRLGSSVGASRADGKDELVEAIRRANLPRSGGVMLERLVDAVLEAECAYLRFGDEKRFSVGTVMTEGREYSFERKYLGRDGIKTLDFYPGDDRERKKITEYSDRLVSALGISGLCRADFFVTAKREILFNEINLMPGFTEESLFPRLHFGEKGSLCEWLFSLASDGGRRI